MKIGLAGRFLMFGFANTVFTYSIFVGLGLIFSPFVAFAVAYSLGITIAGLLSNRLVFKGAPVLNRSLLYLSWHLFIFLLGQALIFFFRPVGFNELALLSLLIIALTVPLNFLSGFLLFRAPHFKKRVNSV